MNLRLNAGQSDLNLTADGYDNTVSQTLDIVYDLVDESGNLIVDESGNQIVAVVQEDFVIPVLNAEPLILTLGEADVTKDIRL